MLSILGGRWSGRKLNAPDRAELRPTLGRVKAAIFSIIESIAWKRGGEVPDFSSWRCLDLFAGVGGLGLEILSRGAGHCVFVEKNRQHARALEGNIKTLGCEENTTVIMEAVEKGDWERHGPYDLVLLDPPYADSHLPELLARLGASAAVKAGAVILFEHDPKVKLGEIPGLQLHSERKLGPAGLTVYLRGE
jgi:16S rRNA (guanine966-N2)-methyltransferase